MSIQNLAELTRGDFPLLDNKSASQHKLIYFDHAATSQKPKDVINALTNYYSHYNANVHRGAHQLSARATESFEGAREITANFVKANSSREIIFTRNASESINLVARSWGEENIREGDEILLTIMEHHSNIVPWQILAKKTGCKLRFAELTVDGELDIEDFLSKLSHRTKLVSLVHISNSLGCCNPIQEVVSIARKFDTLILLDACQSLAHRAIDVASLDVDFLVGSSHKLCGPTGIGFLWSREELLDQMPPFLGGGEMIQEVFLDQSSWSNLPHKFEAGTPAIAEAIGMGVAIKYLENLGFEKIQDWEKTLTTHLFDSLESVEGIKIYGPSINRQPNRGSLASFTIDGVHVNDLAELLDTRGICIRSGHHCCQPLHRYYGIPGTARASLSFTSTIEEINYFKDELISIVDFLKAQI